MLGSNPPRSPLPVQQHAAVLRAQGHPGGRRVPGPPPHGCGGHEGQTGTLSLCFSQLLTPLKASALWCGCCLNFLRGREGGAGARGGFVSGVGTLILGNQWNLVHVGSERLKSLCLRDVPVPHVMEEDPGVLEVGSSLHPFCGLPQVRELKDTEFPHTFLVSGKQRTLELQAR